MLLLVACTATDLPTRTADCSDEFRSNRYSWEHDVRSVFSVLDPRDRDLVVYTHEFGNTFKQAAEQAASLGATPRVPGVMAMFS